MSGLIFSETRCDFFLGTAAVVDSISIVLALLPLLSGLKKLFQYLFLLMGCLQLAGGPLALMQVYAWGSMIATYSKETGVVQAAKDTFSGEKPCHLCCKLEAVKKAEDTRTKDAPPAPEKAGKLVPEMIPADLAMITPPREVAAVAISFASLSSTVLEWSCSPPIPPPRLAA